MPTLQQLRDERASLAKQARELFERIETGDRESGGDAELQWDRVNDRIDEIDKELEHADKDAKRRARLEAIEQELDAPKPRRTSPEPPERPKAEIELRETFGVELRRRLSEGATMRQAVREIGPKYGGEQALTALRSYLLNGLGGMMPQDRAALQVDADASGGYLVLPEQFVAQLIIGLDEAVFIRRLGTLLPLTNAESITAPSLENDPADPTWTSELSTGSADSTMSFGKRRLTPHPLAQRILVSRTLLRKSLIPADALVRDRLTHKLSVVEETAFMTGNGAGQPLGLFTASAMGISTSRDVSTDNTTTAITADGLINAKYNLASQYLMSANLRWIFHRTAVRNIRKLKDGNGNYLWQPGLAAGVPNSILDVPYEMSEYAPSTFTTGLYVGLIGDLRWYWIAESLRVEIQRLDELYAATNQVGFISRLESDGMPVLEEAFTRVTLA